MQRKQVCFYNLAGWIGIHYCMQYQRLSLPEDKLCKNINCVTADQLVQLVEHLTTDREVSGSSPDRTNTQGLKITEEDMLPLQ